MQNLNNLPWEKIHHYLLETGKNRCHQDLCSEAFMNIGNIVPFDSGMLYFLNNNLQPCKHVFLGMAPRISEDYLQYYSKLQNGRFSYTREIVEVDWDEIKSCEFKTDFINPQHVKHVLAVFFYNQHNRLAAAFLINRTGRVKFTPTEKNAISVVSHHLSNLYTNLCFSPTDAEINHSFRKLERPLTRRETEIVHMLCEGMSPKQISDIKALSPRTVYNHMKNIYKKVGVNSQRDLVVKFFK